MDTTTYLDAMYEYLTIPENYNAAMDLSENLNKVDETLRNEFWENVTIELKKRTENLVLSNLENLIFITNKEDVSCQWFQIRKNDWEFYFISTEKEDVGIKMLDGKQAELEIYLPIIKEEIELHKELVGGFRNVVWICWKTFNNFNFHTKAERNSILPNLRERKISECANLLFNYIENLLKLCDSVNKKISEKKQS